MILYTRLAWLALCNMVRTVPELGHIQPEKVAVVAASRSGTSRYGNLAQCIGLGGPEHLDLQYWYLRGSRQVVKITPWFRRENARLCLDGTDMAYLIRLRLPRLLDHHPLETLLHELVHIGPAFDGRIRRMRHGKRFDATVEHITRCWRREGDSELVEALAMNQKELEAKWGAIVALCFRESFVHPRIVPAPDGPPVESHPDFARKGLRFNPQKVQEAPAKWTPEKHPACYRERHLEYRLFRGNRSERISPAALEADLRLFPKDAELFRG